MIITFSEFSLFSLLSSSILLEDFSLLFKVVSHIVTNLGELLLDVFAVSVLLHFAEHESLTKFDGILTIETALHLHREGRCLVVKVEDSQTSGKWGRWLEVVSEVDLWVS